MIWTVYILKSKIAKETYVGHTDNLQRRLEEHNSGKSLFTRRYKPWDVLYNQSFNTKIEAVKKEKYLKSAAGRRWMKKNLFNNN